MQRSQRSFRYLAGAACALGLFVGSISNEAVVSAAAQPVFHVHDLGPVSGYSIGTGISGNGIVTGAYGAQSDVSDGHAFRYKGNAIVTLNNLRGGATSYAFGVNEKGIVVGQSDKPGGVTHAVYWTGTHPHDLGAIHGNLYSAANGINKSGHIVGYSDIDSDAGLNAVEWYRGQKTDLGSLVAGGNSEAYAINIHGAIAGWSDSNTGEQAILIRRNHMTGLGYLPGSNASYAYAVNDSNLVVGESDYSTGLYHAFSYSPWPSAT